MYLSIEGKPYKVNPAAYRESVNKVLFDNFMQVIIKGTDIQTGENNDVLIVLDDLDEMRFNVLIKKEPEMKTKFKSVNSRQVLVTPPHDRPHLLDAVSVKTPKGWFLISKEGLGLLDPSQSNLQELKHYKEEGKYCFVNSDVVIFTEPLNVSSGSTISITNVDSLTDIEKTFTVDPQTSMLDMTTGEIYTGLEVRKFLSQLTKSDKEQEPLYKITNHTTCEKIIIKEKGAGYFTSIDKDIMFITGVSENNSLVTIGFTQREYVSLEITGNPQTITGPMVFAWCYRNLEEIPFAKQKEGNTSTEVLTLTNFFGPDGNLIVKNFVSDTISYLPHNTHDYRVTVIGENQNDEPVNFTFSVNDRVSLIKPGTDFIINNPSEVIEYIVSNYPQSHSTVSGSTETVGISKVEKVVTMFNTLTGKNLTATDIYTITDLILLVDKEG